MIKRPAYIQKLHSFIDLPELIKVIVGVRRAGKSVMLELIQQELMRRGISPKRFIKLNFEKIGFSNLLNAEALHEYLKPRIDAIDGRVYVFLDEIQEVEAWERCLNSLRVETDADIYITGSNAKLLSGEYTTLLSGRYHELPVLPLSFSEYLSAIRDKEPQLSTADAFRKYLRVGGMPFVTAFGLNETDAEAYLEDIYASVVIKDIVRRNKLRNVELLERILMYVFANIGQTFSANSISKYFVSEKRKVSPETVLNYLRAAQDAYLIHRLNRLDVPSKRLLKVDEKYAVVDHGLREAIFGGNERDIERVLENIVCLELMGRGYKVRVGRVANREIDFVCDRGKERLYVQVAYLLANEETIRREFGVYADVPDNFPKYVLSLDEVDLSREGIQHMNIRDFLLNA